MRVRQETVRVVPERPPVASTAVSFALRIAGAALPAGVRILLTAHAVAVGTHWTWILPPARLHLYKEGCGANPAPPMSQTNALDRSLSMFVWPLTTHPQRFDRDPNWRSDALRLGRAE
jgi:hypothetical protein